LSEEHGSLRFEDHRIGWDHWEKRPDISTGAVDRWRMPGHQRIELSRRADKSSYDMLRQ
jgi:hypothetical protein